MRAVLCCTVLPADCSTRCRSFPENSREDARTTRACAVFFAGVRGIAYGIHTQVNCKTKHMKPQINETAEKGCQQRSSGNISGYKEPPSASRCLCCTIFHVLCYVRVQYSKFGLLQIWLLKGSQPAVFSYLPTLPGKRPGHRRLAPHEMTDGKHGLMIHVI